MADRKYNNNSYNDIFNTLFSVSKFPPVDIYENDKGYVITAELAGYDEDKINIFAEKHVLHIASDEHENAKENSDRKYLIKERSVKSFERSFTLPEDANEENITASYKMGILSIFIPKMPKVEPKKIEVKIN
ncbi:Hsp20/alpha crystallin family protein [Spirochaetales bacterium NM-380-WT-3C1]|uniref:Hsp20/alpha crystallin family protein n=1 Tax=Bullifex porci TaxID=2606638 RepID=A0A7X2PB09_9SPIO|nr:Hsp20/alpha crystallin family protein [Bullifex porci]MSU05548.1 Hsp20/alpha crystallin family protein [Bullifex porci]